MSSIVSWTVQFGNEFDVEFSGFAEDVQDNLLAAAKAVQLAGPKAGRPHVDTLNGSKHANMKELRFTANGGRKVWRAAFAFDADRSAIVLVAGEKQGKNQKLFYKWLIKIADRRFDSHLKRLESEKIAKR